jgi:hypothetical protein
MDPQKQGKSKRGKGGEVVKWKLKIFMGVIALAGTMAFFADSWGVEDVRNSKHNLAANTNIGATSSTGATAEVCVFCHTPHGGATDVAGGNAPLWNRTLSTATYEMYTSPNFDGVGMTISGATQPKGVSLACLSCHDGTVAFDALFNLPGSGSPAEAPGNGGIISFNPTSGTPRVDPASGHMINNPSTQEYPMLGTNLSNDHPISMEIPCGLDPQFDGICNNREIGENAGRAAAGKVTYITRDPANFPWPDDVRDRLRAYPSVAGGYYIECASCHNPHIGDPTMGSTDPTARTRFLRLASWDPTDPAYDTSDPNAGSLVCLSCHEK